MKVLVTGAGGNVGSAVMRELRARGVQARAFDRSTETIDVALRGADRLFLACGNVREQVEFETSAIDAAAALGVQRVVKVSAIGASAGSQLVFWDWHGRIEEHLRASGLQAVVLQAASFMTNLLMQADAIGATGKLFASVGDARIAMIDPRDVAAAAAAALADDTIAAGTYTLTGPRAITYAEIAAELGAEYIDVPAETARAGMLASGVPAFVADFLVRLSAELRAGTMSETTTGVRDLTGREPRDFAAFARDHFGAVAA